MKTWILVANAANAKIFTTESLRNGKLKLIREFSHPESRKKVADLLSDKPGSYRTDTEGHGSYENKSDPKGAEADHFSRELATELKTGLDQLEKLILVMGDRFYGLFKKHFQAPNSLNVIHIAKDYTLSNPIDLHDKIKEHIFI